MSQKLPRRNFLTKMAISAASLLSLPLISIARKEQNTMPTEEKKAIKGTQLLGFQWETYDPFLFCAHHEDFFPKGNENMGPAISLKGRQLGDDFIVKDGFRMYHGKDVPGFPGHPHRGFETITIVRKGLVDHADSLGAAGRYGNGDVQWMTAGKGVQHSEMFPLLKSEEENPLELFQVWLNLPKKNKMVDAHFKMFWSESIPVYNKTKGVKIEIIAGELEGLNAPTPPPNSWAADKNNHLAVWNIQLDKGTEWTLPKTEKGVNRTLYFYDGNNINIANTEIPKYHAILLEPDMDIVIKNPHNNSKLLLLQGKPINETVVQYGPFVMNSKEEIMQAFEDYNKTRFGGWPWPKYDQVHDKTKGRFAKHADGKEEVMGG